MHNPNSPQPNSPRVDEIFSECGERRPVKRQTVKPKAGVAAHHCSQPRDWQGFDVDLLQTMATQAGIGIYQSELYQQLQVELQERRRVEAEIRVLNAELEQRVLQPTQQLRQSKASYKAIVESQIELVCRFRPDGTLAVVNEAYCHYFQKSAEELVGFNLFQFIPEHQQKATGQYLASLGADNPGGTWEHAVITPSGKNAGSSGAIAHYSTIRPP